MGIIKEYNFVSVECNFFLYLVCVNLMFYENGILELLK